MLYFTTQMSLGTNHLRYSYTMNGFCKIYFLFHKSLHVQDLFLFIFSHLKCHQHCDIERNFSKCYWFQYFRANEFVWRTFFLWLKIHFAKHFHGFYLSFQQKNWNGRNIWKNNKSISTHIITRVHKSFRNVAHEKLIQKAFYERKIGYDFQSVAFYTLFTFY